MPRKNKLSANEQAICKARNSGNRAALNDYHLKSVKELKKRNGYSDEQAAAYIKAYYEQKLRLARTEGEHAAKNNNELLPKERLINEKNYSEAQALAYIHAYQKTQQRNEQIAALLHSFGEDVKELLGAPSTDVEHTTSDQLVETEYMVDPKVKQAATKAAINNNCCPTFEELTKKRNYNDAEAILYIDTYQKVVANTPDLALRKVRADAQNDVSRGNICPLPESLVDKYSAKQIDEYLSAFAESASHSEAPYLRKARRAGQQAARHAVPLASIEKLKEDKNYCDDEVEAYISGYVKSKPDSDEQALIKARRSAQGAALSGVNMPSVEELQKRGYNPAQINVYIDAYHRSAGTPEEQYLRKARAAGRSVACKNHFDRTKLKSQKCLQNEGYTLEGANAYREAYLKSSARHEQVIKREQEVAKLESAIINDPIDMNADFQENHLKNFTTNINTNQELFEDVNLESNISGEDDTLLQPYKILLWNDWGSPKMPFEDLPLSELEAMTKLPQISEEAMTVMRLR